ncbi:retrovirus-related Pol polyprotein from transposon TNT 1-94, partial [Trifolium medium]|nr:retrovirus-related Pol polyprotein from transposon TNT 1-94 [Trifolium medium]
QYCTFCHRNNHVVEFCYAKHGHPNQGRNGNSNGASVNASNTEGATNSNGNPPHFIGSLNSNASYWLLDSGASDHICSSIHWFSSFYRIKPIDVKLPNGCEIQDDDWLG